jgi:hypothetical protein
VLWLTGVNTASPTKLVDNDNLGDFDFSLKSQNALVAFAGVWAEMRVKLAFNTIKLFGALRRITLDCDVWPLWRIFRVDLQPFVETWLGVWLDRVSGAFRLTNATINAFIGVDNQHVLTLVKTVHGANFHAIHIFTFDAVFSDDVGHGVP